MPVQSFLVRQSSPQQGNFRPGIDALVSSRSLCWPWAELVHSCPNGCKAASVASTQASAGDCRIPKWLRLKVVWLNPCKSEPVPAPVDSSCQLHASRHGKRGFLEFEEEEEGKPGRRRVSLPPRVCQHHAETELPEEKLPEVQLPNAPVVLSMLNPHAASFTGVSGEWLDWIYQLQTNHVLLTPEYTCVRLRGFLGCQAPNPRTHQASTSFVDSRKLRSNDEKVISPAFDLYHPCTGQFLRLPIVHR